MSVAEKEITSPTPFELARDGLKDVDGAIGWNPQYKDALHAKKDELFHQLLELRSQGEAHDMSVHITAHPKMTTNPFSQYNVELRFYDQFRDLIQTSTAPIDRIGYGRGGTVAASELIGKPDERKKETPQQLITRVHNELRYIEKLYKIFADALPDIAGMLRATKVNLVHELLELAERERNNFSFLSFGFFKLAEEGGVILEVDMGEGNSTRFHADMPYFQHIQKVFGIDYFYLPRKRQPNRQK